MDAIAAVLVARDGVDPETARWAAAVAGGHVGRAAGLARSEESRRRRDQVLDIPLRLRGFAQVFAAADALIKAAEGEAAALSETRDVAERLAVEHPDVEHDFPTEMREKAYAWLERFLK